MNTNQRSILIEHEQVVDSHNRDEVWTGVSHLESEPTDRRHGNKDNELEVTCKRLFKFTISFIIFFTILGVVIWSKLKTTDSESKDTDPMPKCSTDSRSFDVDKSCEYFCTISEDSVIDNQPFEFKFMGEGYGSIMMTYSYQAMKFKWNKSSKMRVSIDKNITCSGYETSGYFDPPHSHRFCVKTLKRDYGKNDSYHRHLHEQCANLTLDGACDYQLPVTRLFNELPYRFRVNESYELFSPSWLTIYNYIDQFDGLKIARIYTPSMYIGLLHYHEMVPIKKDFYSPLGSSMVWSVTNVTEAKKSGQIKANVCYTFNMYYASSLYKR